jgi:hypothetical protein
MGDNFTFRDFPPGEAPEELLATEVVVPNAFYGVVLSAGIEAVILAQAAGLFYRADPDATWMHLKVGLQGAGDLDDAEIEQAWNGLIATTDMNQIGGTLYVMGASWPGSKQMALLNHIAMVAQATAQHAYGHVYGTGAALPMFVKMTAAEALNWNGHAKGDPIGGISNLGFGQLSNKSVASKQKGGDTTIYIGPNTEDPQKTFRYVKKDKNVTQRCHFDPDCMAQQKFIDAGKGGAAKDVCDAGRVEIPGKGFRVCDPLTVGGYQAAFMMPSPLFGSDEGTSEYGPGKLADVWVGGVAKVTFRNTGPQIWHDRDDVMVHRWVPEFAHDRRENCDGADKENAVGLDCSSPLKTWSLAPWYASTMPPPLYVSTLNFEASEETMYKSTCPSTNSTSRKECHDKGEHFEGSVVKTKWTESRMWTVGPYDPAEKVIFLNPVSVDNLLHLDTEPNTGLILRASKPMMASMRLYPSLLFPNVGDVLIPCFAITEEASSSLGLRRIVRTLQGAVKAQFSTLPAMTGVGTILVVTAILQCAWRIAPRKPEASKDEQKEEKKEEIILC